METDPLCPLGNCKLVQLQGALSLSNLDLLAASLHACMHQLHSQTSEIFGVNFGNFSEFKNLISNYRKVKFNEKNGSNASDSQKLVYKSPGIYNGFQQVAKGMQGVRTPNYFYFNTLFIIKFQIKQFLEDDHHFSYIIKLKVEKKKKKKTTSPD